MSVDEAARHRLFNRATEILGQEEAEILMAHLPPGGWSNLATKQDMLALKQDIVALKQDLVGLNQDVRTLKQEVLEDFDDTERRIVAELKSYTLRTVLLANLAMAGMFAGIAFTAAGIGS